jgi:protease IV
MTTDSLFKSALRSFSNTFFKVIGFSIAIMFMVIALNVMLSGSPQRMTTTIMQPTHHWRVKPFSVTTPTILQIPITGVIGLEPSMKKERVEAMLQDLQELDLRPGMLKAIILMINSPGGTADDSDAIFRMISEYKKQFKIPVYAYIDGLCASGGTLISLSADKIIASAASTIGHVGVIMGTSFNVSKTMERFGVESKTIFAGKNKDELNPFRPWKPNEGEDFQDLADVYYSRFVNLVTTHRPRITEEALREDGAKLYPAEQALEVGYIDQVSDSYFSTLSEITSSLEISSDYQVIQLKPQMFFSELFGPETSARAMHHFLRLPGDMHPELSGKPLYMYFQRD